MHSADLALSFHFTLIVIADSCLDGRLPKGQVSQRDIITQAGKYLRALFNDTILFYNEGLASSLTASVPSRNIVWQKPFKFFCKIKRNKPWGYKSMVDDQIPGKS